MLAYSLTDRERRWDMANRGRQRQKGDPLDPAVKQVEAGGKLLRISAARGQKFADFLRTYIRSSILAGISSICVLSVSVADEPVVLLDVAQDLHVFVCDEVDRYALASKAP